MKNNKHDNHSNTTNTTSTNNTNTTTRICYSCMEHMPKSTKKFCDNCYINYTAKERDTNESLNVLKLMSSVKDIID